MSMKAKSSFTVREFVVGKEARNGLMVISETGRNRHGKRMFRFKCKCGRIFSAVGGDVAQGRIFSCGCYRKAVCGNNARRLPDGQAARHFLYFHYRDKCARARGLSFELTKEQFCALVSQNCYYCGCSPAQTLNKERRRKKQTDPKIVYVYKLRCVYNGIDRLNNAFGYVLENCVPCCGTCNRAKQTMSLMEFATWIKKLANNRVLMGYA